MPRPSSSTGCCGAARCLRERSQAEQHDAQPNLARVRCVESIAPSFPGRRAPPSVLVVQSTSAAKAKTPVQRLDGCYFAYLPTTAVPGNFRPSFHRCIEGSHDPRRSPACYCCWPRASARPAAAADTIGGRVFADDDGDGMFDAGESGIADVAVSNGRIVTRTDAAGAYRRPCSAARPSSSSSPRHGAPPGAPIACRCSGGSNRWRGRRRSSTADCRTGQLRHGSIFALQREPRREGDLDVLVFGDPQPKIDDRCRLLRSRHRRAAGRAGTRRGSA